MIRVLIAEDEPPTLRRIKRMIEQSDPAFQVSATAFDGEQALALMEEGPCDVVFSDIRMPVMDGLALMDRIRERYPDCLLVIISGYQDFAYVTHAMRSRAIDYLLKPVSQQDLDALLSRLKEVFTQRKRERLARQLSATLNRAEAVGRAEPPVGGDARFHVCLFCAGPMPLDGDAELLGGNAAFDRLFMEERIPAMCPAYEGFTWAFMGNTQVEQILILEASGISAVEIASELMRTIERDTQVPISCACAAQSVSLKEIGRTIQRLREALMASVRIGEGTLTLVSEDTPPIPPAARDAQEVKNLAALLGEGRLSPKGERWQALLSRMEREAWTQRRIHTLFLDAFAQLESEQGGAGAYQQAKNLVAEVIESALSWQDLREGFGGLAPLLGGEKETSVTQHNVARRVEAYLTAHYDEHINNQKLGQAFGYVPSYISLLFRKEYGVSPAEYLTRVRLFQAKALIQQNPGMLIRDVAERVGFKSPHHFSRTFKKYEGVWPTGYPQ